MSQPTDPSLVGVEAATSLADAGLLMVAHGVPCAALLRDGARVGTLHLRDVARGLRRATAARNASDAMVDGAAAADDPPPPDPADDPPTGGEPAGLFQPDLLLSSQYLDRMRRSAEFEPERRLMVAVLERGVNDYLQHIAPRDAAEVEIWRDAAAWVADDDATWLYSFRRICDTLGIDPDYLRRGLYAARERARGGAPAREEAPVEAPEEAAEPAANRASAGSG
jgi:hypothetical protein